MPRPAQRTAQENYAHHHIICMGMGMQYAIFMGMQYAIFIPIT